MMIIIRARASVTRERNVVYICGMVASVLCRFRYDASVMTSAAVALDWMSEVSELMVLGGDRWSDRDSGAGVFNERMIIHSFGEEYMVWLIYTSI